MAIATGQITIVDYNDAVSLTGAVTSNLPRTVIYKSSDLTLTPSWGAPTSLILTASMFAAGNGVDILTAGTNIKSNSWKWYEKIDSLPKTLITSGGGGYTVATTPPYTLTVAQNKLASASNITFTFECIYIDPNTLLELTWPADITFTKVESGTAVIPIATAPFGNIFKNNTPATISLKCSLWKGAIEDATATYQWYQDDSTSVSTTLTGVNTTTALVVGSTGGLVVGQSILVGSDARTISSITDATHMAINLAPLAGNQANGTIVKAATYDSWAGQGWKTLVNGALYSGATAQTIVVYPDAVLNIATFKCKITDTIDGTGVYSDSVVVLDYTDPYYLDVTSSAGLFFKPGVSENTTLTATLMQNGAACSVPSGKNYTWRLRDKDGNAMNFVSVPSTATRTGPTIAITGADITVKGTITASVE